MFMKVFFRACVFGITVAVSSMRAAPIHTAASTGDLSSLERMIASGMPVDLPHEVSELTPWQAATMHGRKEAAELLAKAGADTKREIPPGEVTMDRILKASVKQDGPGFAVLVSRDGKILYERAFGLANLENKMPNTTETVFRIGSVTKQFVAAAVLLSEEDGKLKVSDTLKTFYPDFPRADKITLHHLLTHTSGIHSFTAMPDFMKQVGKPITQEQLVATFAKAPPDFAPGESHLYCNSGYVLLAEIERKAQGKAYYDLLKERVFAKEGMDTTGPHRPDLGLAKEAKGYTAKKGADKGWMPALDWHMSQAGGAGELYSTVGDLYRWNEALFNGRVLKAESVKKAHTPIRDWPNPPKDDSGDDYAYGWVVGEMRGLKSIWHNGSVDGFSSELRRYPDQKLTVVVLCNTRSPIGALTTSGVADIATRQFLWREMEPQPCFREQPLAQGTKLEDYVGTFDLGGLGVMRFRIERGRLQAKLADQKWGEIAPSAKDAFREHSVDADFMFQRDDKGAVSAVTLKQHGAKLSGKRYQEAKEGKAAPGLLDAFSGTYTLGMQKFVLRLSPRGSSILGKLGEQSEFAYFPVEGNANRLFCKAVRVELEFKRDGDGKVTGFILHQNGLMLAAHRMVK